MRRTIGVLTVLALLAAACNGDDDEGGGDATVATTPTESDPPDTTPPGTDPSDTTPPGTDPPGTDPPVVACPAGTTTGPLVVVNQSVQTEDNAVQLIAQRSTSVRVAVAAGELAGGDEYTGVLRVYVDGSEITGGGVSSIDGPVTAPATPNRDDAGQTLNFELPAPTGIAPSGNVEFCVELNPTGGAVEVAAVAGLDVAESVNPRIFYTRVDYDGLGTANVADIQPGVGDLFIQGIFPFDDSDPNLYKGSPFPILTNSSDVETDQFVDRDTDVDNLLADIGASRQLIVGAGLGADNTTFLYGWLPGNPIEGNGWATIDGRVAFGNTDLVRSQRTFAHELGHNFGLSHNDRSLDPDTGWDTGARLENNPAANDTLGRVKQTTRSDIMRGGQRTNTAWVDVETYEFFLSNPLLAVAGTGGSSGADLPAPSERVAVVTGVLTDDGSGVRTLFPVQRFPWASQPTQPPRDPGYVAVIETKRGETITAPFGGRVGAGGEGPGWERFGYFEVMVPVDADVEIDSLTIETLDGDFLDGVVAGDPPDVFIDRPQNGGVLDGIVSWELDDPDSADDELLIQIAFSPDRGQSWVPVAVNLPGTTRRYAYDPSLLPPTDRGDGVLRLLVSDGLNTTFDNSGRLSEADEAEAPEGIVVPDEREYPTLEKLLIGLELPTVVRFRPRLEVDAGIVFDIDPPAGTVVDPGSTVFIDVSTGRPSGTFRIVSDRAELAVGVRSDDTTLTEGPDGQVTSPQIEALEATAAKLWETDVFPEFFPLTANEARVAVRSGEIDVLLNSTERLDGPVNIPYVLDGETFYMVVIDRVFAQELRLNVDRVVRES